MRFMMIVKATRHSEAGVNHSGRLLEAMNACCEDMSKAGVLLAAEWLCPSSKGIRLTYPVAGGKPNVLAGPFEEIDGLVAG
ncbi:YciI family protein [Gordoniibacillus kamchatkensis]|uniref:YciI family protein n=1 Tax=Gordoniibacillus kamchatkensis TaxID=1590651 RepID=UPI000A7B8B27|nr:YciI family protein [Paenibacillus sp. VKM B-2647]